MGEREVKEIEKIRRKWCRLLRNKDKHAVLLCIFRSGPLGVLISINLRPLNSLNSWII